MMVSVPVENAVKTVQVPEVKLTDAQKIALLRKEAHERGLSFKVFCTKNFVDDPEGFQADAWRTKDGGFHEVAFSLIDFWREYAPTQADAAYALYKSIKGDPPRLAKTETTEGKKRERFICPLPDLNGN